MPTPSTFPIWMSRWNRRTSSPTCGSSRRGATVPPNISRAGASRGGLAAGNAPVMCAYARSVGQVRAGNRDRHRREQPGRTGRGLFRRGHRAQPGDRDRRIFGHAAVSGARLPPRSEYAASGVSGFMLGEHGDAQVPVWSSVQVHGMDAAELAATVRPPATRHDARRFCRNLPARAKSRDRIVDRRAGGRGVHPGGYPRVGRARDRQAVRDASFRQQDRPRHGQRDGPISSAHCSTVGKSWSPDRPCWKAIFTGCTVPLGVPVVAGTNGISRVVEIPLTDQELARLTAISRRMQEQVKSWMSAAF